MIGIWRITWAVARVEEGVLKAFDIIYLVFDSSSVNRRPQPYVMNVPDTIFTILENRRCNQCIRVENLGITYS